ncbi:MAG: 30S ribosomal protein S12 methylthiotransferase RimO [Saprospiraceae bacterium]|nr:30S ribosomal protein S12 methylthiotransferase RimO [Saprospiraceae bacterium]MBK7737155.1 30S ribosomal protein S12 methylthiotransferase RimO [Saprospiraceae bacterium]
MKTKKQISNKIQIVTLGCSKNWVDSENLITQLKYNQFEVEHNPIKEVSQTVVINTCGFIDRAKEESINTILEYANLKKQGKLEKLYVTGCLSQRYKDNLEEEIPEVDAFFGTMEMPGLLAKLNADYKKELIGERIVTTPAHFAYLKISEGCNRTCSFCAIPLMRGKHRSVPIEDLVIQAKHLAKYGVKELILIAQELTYYGLDLYKKRALNELLHKLAAIDGIEWIRLHYAYPSKFPLEILDVIRDEPKICNYIDLPLQHISDPILTAMKRQISKEETIQLVQTIRDKIPGIHFRTTFLVGFPGETDAIFQELCEFVRFAKFERMGVFQYSQEEDTSAYQLGDLVSPETKEARAAELMAIQEDISYELNQKKLNKVYKVLIDKKENNYYFGRTEFDSPEVDNDVLFENPSTNYLRIGDFVNARIIKADAYDLIAVPEF